MVIKSYEDLIWILLQYPKHFDWDWLCDKLVWLADLSENEKPISLKKLNLLLKEFIIRFEINERKINEFIKLNDTEELEDIVLKYPPKRQF